LDIPPATGHGFESLGSAGADYRHRKETNDIGNLPAATNSV